MEKEIKGEMKVKRSTSLCLDDKMVKPRIYEGYIRDRGTTIYGTPFILLEGIDGYNYTIWNPQGYYTNRSEKENQEWYKKVHSPAAERIKEKRQRRDEIKSFFKPLLALQAYVLGAAIAIGGPCYAISKACGSDTQEQHAITLESKCRELNSERPELKLQEQEYTLQCDNDGKPVLYEE